MSWGIRLRDSAGNPVIDRTQTFLRIITSFIVPYTTSTITTTYSIPNFDDTKGLFSWRTYRGDEVIVAFDTLHWNDVTRIFTVTHRGTSPTPSGLKFNFTFFHYR